MLALQTKEIGTKMKKSIDNFANRIDPEKTVLSGYYRNYPSFPSPILRDFPKYSCVIYHFIGNSILRSLVKIFLKIMFEFKIQ